MTNRAHRQQRELAVVYMPQFTDWPWRIVELKHHLGSNTTRDYAIKNAINWVKQDHPYFNAHRIKVYDEMNELKFTITKVKGL